MGDVIVQNPTSSNNDKKRKLQAFFDKNSLERDKSFAERIKAYLATLL